MHCKKVAVVSDNSFVLQKFLSVLKTKKINYNLFDFFYSYNNSKFISDLNEKELFRPINIKENVNQLLKKYNLILSLHCNQIFPKELIDNCKCINFHPGYIPYNRGWYPQVFSIINGLTCGATIHEMTNNIDYGPIIAREKVKINDYDTSYEVYMKILEVEINLIDRWIEKILSNNYKTYMPECKGNINYKKDYEKLKQISLNSTINFKQAIDILRALSHKDYNNAFFEDEKGQKVFMSINMKKE